MTDKEISLPLSFILIKFVHIDRKRMRGMHKYLFGNFLGIKRLTKDRTGKNWRCKEICSKAKAISFETLMRPFDVITCRAIIGPFQKLKIIIQQTEDDEILIIWILLYFHKSLFSLSLGCN